MKKTLVATCAILLFAAIASADNHGAPPSAFPGGGDFGHGGAPLIVTSNGTVIISDTVIDTGTHTATTTVKAIGSSGTVLWTSTFTNGHGFTLSGSNLLSVNQTVASDGTATSTITAISTSTGATAWTQTVNGRINELHPFSGGTYVVVVVPATTAGGTATRSLIALSDSGTQLWSISI